MMKKRNKKNRKRILTLLSLLLVLCTTIGISYAWLHSVTGEKHNVFSPAENIRAKLTEPNWNPDEGLKLVPGKTVRKDPMITNTSDINEYVAIRLTFQYGDINRAGETMAETDLLRLLNLITIDWNSKWKLCSGSLDIDGTTGQVTGVSPELIFYYDEIVPPGKVTDPIFSSVTVTDKSDGLLEEDLLWMQALKFEAGEMVSDPDGIGKFHIIAEGAAIQAHSIETAKDAADALKALFGSIAP